MTRRLIFPTAAHVGPYRIVTYRQVRGFGIVDERTGRPAWVEPHPFTGRPRAVIVPTIPIALRIARSLDHA